MKTTLLTIVATAALLWPSALSARHCCRAAHGGHQHSGTAHQDHASGHQPNAAAHQHGITPRQEPAHELPQPARAAFDNYIKIQIALASDSMEGIHVATTAMLKAIESDAEQTLPAELNRPVRSLAMARDVKAARQAFKPVSDALIQHLEANPDHAGRYARVYCAMADSRWLQTEHEVTNPYFGSSMLRCGEFEPWEHHKS
jgi:hypothetical protein